MRFILIHTQAKLVSHPEELINSYKPGEPVVMELTVDVYPEVAFTGSYKGLKVRACVGILS